jgi:hypothetical protein
MALFVVGYNKNTDRSDPHWTGFPTWSEVGGSDTGSTVTIYVPDNCLPPGQPSASQLTAYWQKMYPSVADKMVTVLPPNG